MNASVIESVGQANLEKVLPLIRAYQELYLVSEISDDKNHEFFQFGEANPAEFQFLDLTHGKPKEAAHRGVTEGILLSLLH